MKKTFLVGTLALEICEKEETLVSTTVKRNSCCWVLQQQLNHKNSSLFELRKAAMAIQLDFTPNEIATFKSLWDLILENEGFNSFSPAIIINANPNKNVLGQFESATPNERLNLVWHYFVKISQSYSLCPQLLCQREYISELSPIIAFLLLLAPSQKKFQNLLCCLVISPIASGFLMEIMNKNWIPLDFLLDAIIAIMKDTLPPQNGFNQQSGYKLSRSPSLMVDEDIPIRESESTGTLWDQLLSFDSFAHKTVPSSLKAIMSEMLKSLCSQCNHDQLIHIRARLSQNQLLPLLCIQFTRDRLTDLWNYFDNLLDETLHCLTGYSEGAVPLAISRLDEHWLFSHLSLDLISELLNELFQDLFQILTKNYHLKKKIYILFRLICTLLSSTQNIYKLSHPNPSLPSSSERSRHWIELKIEQAMEIIQTTLPSTQQQESSHLFRLITTLVFVFIISSRRNTPSSTASSIASSSSVTSSSSFVPPSDHLTLLTKFVQFHHEFQCSAPSHLVYCSYITTCLSLERIGFIRDSCAREICLDRFIDFLPQNSFLYLTHIMAGFQQKMSSNSNSGSGSGGFEGQGQGQGQGPVEFTLIEKNREKLLQNVSQHSLPPLSLLLEIITTFLSFPVPSIISSYSEFPGDYLCSFSFILKYRLMFILNPFSPTFKEVLKRFKQIFLQVLQNVSWPPHSSLQDVIDNWVEITVNGGDGFLDSQHSPPTHGGNQKQVHEGNLLLMTIYPEEILQQTSDLMLVKPADVATATATTTALPLSQAKVSDPNSDLTTNTKIVDESLSSHDHLTVINQDSSPLILDSELLEKSNALMRKTSRSTEMNNFHISNQYMRAAVHCYLSLKYQSICSMSPHTQYTCVFSTDPRDLPLRGSLIIFLHTAAWESYYRQHQHQYQLMSLSELIHKSYSFSDCSHEFFSGFIRLVRMQSPELLIQERSHTLIQSHLVTKLIDSLPVNSLHFHCEDVFNYSLESLLSSHCSTSRLTLLFNYLKPTEMTKTMGRLLRVILLAVPSPTSNGSKSSFCNSIISPAIPHIELLLSDPVKCERILHNLWSLWRAIHDLHLIPAQYELESLNILLDLSHSHHPHAVASYLSLVREPLVLFRLPLICYQHYTTLNILLTIFRSVIIASRAHCHETYRINKSISKQVLSHPIVPNSSLATSSSFSVVFKSPHVAPTPIMARDGSSRIENCDMIDENDFINLQDLMSLRLISEIWTQICSVNTTPLTMSPSDPRLFPIEKGNLKEWLRIQIPENLYHSFHSITSLLLKENPGVIDSLLYYGIPSFPSFYLLASSSSSSSSSSFPSILNLFIERIHSSISNHTEPYMNSATKNMDLTILHLQHLLICLLDLNSSTLRHVTSTETHINLQLSAHQTITLFTTFLKKSLKFHCWKQQYTANPTLGRYLLRFLSIFSSFFPHDVLKMIANCTSKDLFASATSSSPALLSPTSVLGELQHKLFELRSQIYSKIGKVNEMKVNKTPQDPMKVPKKEERDADDDKEDDEDLPKEKRQRTENHGKEEEEER